MMSGNEKEHTRLKEYLVGIIKMLLLYSFSIANYIIIMVFIVYVYNQGKCTFKQKVYC